MKAMLLKHDKFHDPYGNLVEMKIWSVPVSGHTPFGVKYSLVYIVDDERVIGYDNERGKGDHRHCNGGEFSYYFVDVDSMIEDFIHDVEEYIRRRYES